MAKSVKSNPIIFAEIENRVKQFDAAGRTASIALLLWFLETVYRLDQVEAEDAVCDSPGDAGFDAVAADDLRREIVVFQAKRRESIPATLGDVDLKIFVGSLAQLNTATSVKKLITTTFNADLKQLLLDLDVAEKINADYKIRAIFVTNVAANRDATTYWLMPNQPGITLIFGISIGCVPYLTSFDATGSYLTTFVSKWIPNGCFVLEYRRLNRILCTLRFALGNSFTFQALMIPGSLLRTFAWD